MKIHMGQVTERSGVINKGNTVIAPNLVREREMLNSNGDVIDPRTKQIIKRAEA
jgi:hypothetical protein